MVMPRISRRKTLFLLFGLSVVLSYLFFFSEQNPLLLGRIGNARNQLLAWDKLFAQPKQEFSVHHVEDLYDDLLYLNNLKEIYQELLPTNPDPFYEPAAVNETKWENCFYSSDFFRMYTDMECMWMWLYKLKNDWVVAIDKITGVLTLEEEHEIVYLSDKPNSNGGMRAKLSDFKTKGYWKPCMLDTGHHESYFGEINAFLVDRALGFFHTPAVLPRAFLTTRLRELAEYTENRKKYARNGEPTRKIESIIDHCGTVKKNRTDYVEGAFIGWSPFLLQAVVGSDQDKIGFVAFTQMDETEVKHWKENLFNVDRNSPPRHIEMVLETISAQLFALITGNLNKFDHNLFRAVDGINEEILGPFNYIDNDRTQWDVSTSRSRKLFPVNPWKEFCKFPERIAHRILLLRPGNPRDFTLGTFMNEISSIFRPHMKNANLFSEEQGRILDQNIAFVAALIDSCLALHPPDHVFIPEPWKQPQVYSDIRGLFDNTILKEKIN